MLLICSLNPKNKMSCNGTFFLKLLNAIPKSIYVMRSRKTQHMVKLHVVPFVDIDTIGKLG